MCVCVWRSYSRVGGGAGEETAVEGLLGEGGGGGVAGPWHDVHRHPAGQLRERHVHLPAPAGILRSCSMPSCICPQRGKRSTEKGPIPCTRSDPRSRSLPPCTCSRARWARGTGVPSLQAADVFIESPQRRSVRHHSATWQRKVIYIVVMFLYIFELVCSCIQACVCGCIMFSITRVKSSYTSYRFISYHKQMKIFWPCCIVQALDVSSLGCIKVNEALLALSRKQLPRFKS